MNQDSRSILIVGGGVIGMSTAYELASRGAKVTVLDQGAPGFGCSYGNAGWITPCFAMPLPMPGMFLKSIKWLLDPLSPLHIQPRPSLLLARWLYRFLTAMNEPQMKRSVKALVDLSKYSLDFYMNLEHLTKSKTHFEQKGLLMVSRTDEGLASAINEMNLVAEQGIPGQLLNETQLREFEPSLQGKLKGGVYFSKEAHAEPLKIVEAFRAGALAQGVEIVSGTEVYDFEMQGSKIKSVLTTKGTFTADVVVMATGSWSNRIGKRLGLKVPILGGKGYSIIVPKFENAPRVPIMIVEKKIAVTPRDSTVRLAGTLELVHEDYSITIKRLNNILKGSREFLPIPENVEIKEVWRGLRPCTPDGVPLIGFSKRVPNLFYVTGHQMLGLQSAPGSARVAADLLLGSANPMFDSKPFDPQRFE